MRNFKSRLDRLEPLFVAEPDPDQLNRTRARLAVSEPLTAGDLDVVPFSGGFVGAASGWAGAGNNRRCEEAVRRSGRLDVAVCFSRTGSQRVESWLTR